MQNSLLGQNIDQITKPHHSDDKRISNIKILENNDVSCLGFVQKRFIRDILRASLT